MFYGWKSFELTPDIISDFKNLPFPNNTFYQVLFKKYGALNKGSWREDLSKGLSEAFRVLKVGGKLLFK